MAAVLYGQDHMHICLALGVHRRLHFFEVYCKDSTHQCNDGRLQHTQSLCYLTVVNATGVMSLVNV